MIKLFEPFQPKIGLHINTGFLQSLWDKYVPRTSESYDRISLIHLQGMQGADTKPKQQVNLLVNLVLKNIFVQMNLSQNPMLLNQAMLNHSVKQMRKIYLQQLKRVDFQLYQSLNQYTAYLERTEKEEIRYREWTKENKIITQMQREYQVLYDVSRRLKELTVVQSVQLEKKYGKILFQTLDKKEYKILTEAFLWAEKKQVEEYIQHCSEEQYLRILKHLEKDPRLYTLLKEAGGPEDITDRIPLADASQIVSKEQLIAMIRFYGQKEFRKFCHQVLFPDLEMNNEYSGLLQAGILWKKDKKEIYQQFEQMKAEEIHHFWEEIPLITAKICQMQEDLQQERQTVYQENQQQEGQNVYLKDLRQKGYVVHSEGLQQEEQGVYSEKLQQEQQNMQQKKKSRLRYKVCRKFSVGLEQVQTKYVAEIKEYIQNIVLRTEEQDEYEIIKNAVDIRPVLEKDSIQVHRKSEGKEETSQEAVPFPMTMDKADAKVTENQIFWCHIDQMERALAYRLKEQEQRIIQREQQVLEKYKDIYTEILSEKEIISKQQPSQRSAKSLKNQAQESENLLTVRTYAQEASMQSDIIYSDSLQDGENRAIENIDTENINTENINTENIDIEETFRQKYGITKLSKSFIQKLKSWSEVILSLTERGQEKTQTELLQQQIQASKDKADFQQLVVQLVHYMEDEEENGGINADAEAKQHEQDMSGKALLLYREEQLQNVRIQELLQYFRQVKEEEQQELLRQLADMLVIQKKIADMDITQKQAADMDIIQKQVADIDIVQKQITDIDIIQKQTEDINITQKHTVQEDISERQQEGTLQYVKENIIEKTFRQKYEKNNLSQTFIQKLESWSEALLSLTEQDQEKMQTEVIRKQIQASKDKADFQWLAVQLAPYMEEEERNGESDADTKFIQPAQDMAGTALFVFREEHLEDAKIQELLQHLRQIKEEERQEFIRQLGGMINIQKQITDTNRTQRQIADASQIQKQIADTSQIQKQITSANLLQKQTADMSILQSQTEQGNSLAGQYKELQEWGRALLYSNKRNSQSEGYNTRDEYWGDHPAQETRAEETDILIELQAGKENLSAEELQTQIIRHQIETSKHRTELQRVLMQVNHHMKAAGFQIEYNERQLQDPSVRGLLTWLGQMEESKYQEAVNQLSDIVLQLRTREQQIFREEPARKDDITFPIQVGKNREPLQETGKLGYRQRADSQRIYEGYLKPEYGQKNLERYPAAEHNYGNQEGYPKPEYSQRIYELYPELAHRIQLYEEQRKRTRTMEAGRLKTVYTDVIETVLQSEDSKVQEAERLYLVSAHPGYTDHQDIKYVFSEETLSGRKQKNGADTQKETLQVKSLQQQMDVRLREVERQLQKKADGHSGAGDDIRTIAEKVKKQLHEELHMERLRRGMT